MNIVYGPHTIDAAALPEQSMKALLQRGITHFLGNEQASKVASWAEGFETKNSRKPTDAERDTAKADYVAGALKALAEGTIGVRSGGPRGSPTDTVIRQLARAEVVGILTTQKVKVPKGEEKVKFGDGTELTLAEMVSRRIAKHGDRLTKEAEAKLKADARKAEKTAEAAKASGATGADILDA